MGTNSIFQERVIQVTEGMFELCSKTSRYLFIKWRRWRRVVGQKKTFPGKGTACRKQSYECQVYAVGWGVGSWAVVHECEVGWDLVRHS